jgi:hypothetical protein
VYLQEREEEVRMLTDLRIRQTIETLGIQLVNYTDYLAAISGDLLSAVISIRYIFGFRKDNPNVFNSLIQSWPHF